jgi:hypothetical protein
VHVVTVAPDRLALACGFGAGLLDEYRSAGGVGNGLWPRAMI